MRSTATPSRSISSIVSEKASDGRTVAAAANAA
jgi:hypothetical protein